MPPVAIDLGTPPAAPPTSAPTATRTRTPGWRDPRLWVGVVVVAGSVLLGARVVGAADDTVTVWAAAAELPADAVLERSVGAGELVPGAALGAGGDSDLLQLAVAVEPEQLAGAVAAGSRVNVYLVARGGGDRGHDSGEPVLEDVVVLDAAAADDGYAASGLRRLVLAVPEDDAGRYYGLLGSLTDPLVSVAVRG